MRGIALAIAAIAIPDRTGPGPGLHAVAKTEAGAPASYWEARGFKTGEPALLRALALRQRPKRGPLP